MSLKSITKDVLALIGGHPKLLDNLSEDRIDFANTMNREYSTLTERLFDPEHYKSGAISLTHFGCLWVKYGMPVFQVSKDLLALLTLTDCSNMLRKDIKLPFPSFVISIPYDFWNISLDGINNEPNFNFTRDKINPISFITVSRYRTHNEKDPLELLYKMSNKIKMNYIEMVYISAMSDCNFGLNLWEEIEWIGEKVGDWCEVSSVEKNGKSDPRIPKEEKAMQIAIRRLIINLSLYIAEYGKGKKVRNFNKKKRKSKRKKFNLQKPEVWIIGKEIKIDNNLIESAKVCDLPSKRDQWKIKSRFTVRGHWRNQAYGPGRAQRKRIWIQPHWKGPECGNKISHLYVGAKR